MAASPPPPPGWYADPHGGPNQRYWDGTQWTDHVQADAPPPPGSAPPVAESASPKKKRHTARNVLAIVAALVILMVVISALGGGSDDPAPAGDGSAAKGASAKNSAKAGCGTTATDDCTPRVGQGQAVTVDALTWRVQGVRTAATLGDPGAFGEKADGRFVVVKLSVTSNHDEAVTLSDSMVKLEVEGTTYDSDTSALIGSGETPFFLDDLGPDITKRGTVVFDVPPSKIGRPMALRFGEMGLGTSHAYVTIRP